MKNRQFRRALAVLTAALVTVTSVPATTGAAAFTDGEQTENSVTEIQHNSENVEAVLDDESGFVGETEETSTYGNSGEVDFAEDATDSVEIAADEETEAVDAAGNSDETDVDDFGDGEFSADTAEDLQALDAGTASGDGLSAETSHDLQDSGTEPWEVKMTASEQSFFMKYTFKKDTYYKIKIMGDYGLAFLEAGREPGTYDSNIAGLDGYIDSSQELRIHSDTDQTLYLKLNLEYCYTGEMLSVSINEASLVVDKDSDDITGIIDEPVTLKADATSTLGNDRLKYQWKIYESEIDDYKNIAGATDASYTIKSLGDASSYYYCCEISDGNDTFIKKFRISVTAEMKVTTALYNYLDVWPGDKVSLKVDATSKREIYYKWFANSDLIEGETDSLYEFVYQKGMPTSYKCNLGDGYNSAVCLFYLRTHDASDPRAVKIELAEDEAPWFLKGYISDIKPSKDVKVTYDNGETKTVSPENLDVSVTGDHPDNHYTPGKYTRTISYRGCSVTDDIYIVGFDEGENGVQLEANDPLKGQTADTYSFCRITPEQRGDYDISFTNVTGTGQVRLYSARDKSTVGTLTLDGKDDTLSFYWTGYPETCYYIAVQGNDTLTYDIEYGKLENKLTLGETVSVKPDSGDSSGDATYTFTPEVSGFYNMTAEHCSALDLQSQSGEYLGDILFTQYLKKGQKYYFSGYISNENATWCLNLKEASTAYEDCVSAGKIDGSAYKGSWKLEGTTLELFGEGYLGTPTVGEMIGSNAEIVKSLIIHEGCISIAEGYRYTGYFRNLTNLEMVSLPASLKRIGNYAFADLKELKTVKLPENANLSDVGVGAFEECGLYEYAGDYIMLGSMVLKYKGEGESTTIPANASALISHSMAYNPTLKKITILNNLKKIGDHSISYCKNLEEIEVPSNVTHIAYAAFASDTQLENLTLNEGLEEIGKDAFLNCPELHEITIPKSVTKIGDHAIGYSGYSEDYYAITKYPKEERPTINCWYNTAGYQYARQEEMPYKLLDEKKLTSNNPSLCSMSVSQSLSANGSYSIAVKVRFADDFLTEGKDFTFTYVSLGNGKLKVTATGCGEYTGTCEQIVSDIRQNQTPAKPTTTPSKPTTTPAKPTTAPAKPLKKGTSFTVGTNKYKVTGTKVVTYAGTTNKKATKITIGQTVSYKGVTYQITSVNSKALKNHAKVTQITIGNKVTSVGTSAFEGCKALKKVTVGTGVKTLGTNTFKNCKKLSSITIKSKQLKTVKSNVFKGIYAKAKIRVPSSKLKAYQKLLKKKGQGSKVKITK